MVSLKGNYFLVILFALFVAGWFMGGIFFNIAYSGLRYQCMYFVCSGSWKIFFFPVVSQNGTQCLKTAQISFKS